MVQKAWCARASISHTENRKNNMKKVCRNAESGVPYQRMVIPNHFFLFFVIGETADDGATDYGSKLDKQMDAAAAKQKAGGRLTNKEKKLLK